MNRIEENIMRYEAPNNQEGEWKYLARETKIGEVAIGLIHSITNTVIGEAIVVDDRTAKLMTDKPRDYMTREVT